MLTQRITLRSVLESGVKGARAEYRRLLDLCERTRNDDENGAIRRLQLLKASREFRRAKQQLQAHLDGAFVMVQRGPLADALAALPPLQIECRTCEARRSFQAAELAKRAGWRFNSASGDWYCAAHACDAPYIRRKDR